MLIQICKMVKRIQKFITIFKGEEQIQIIHFRNYNVINKIISGTVGISKIEMFKSIAKTDLIRIIMGSIIMVQITKLLKMNKDQKIKRLI